MNYAYIYLKNYDLKNNVGIKKRQNTVYMVWPEGGGAYVKADQSEFADCLPPVTNEKS